MTNLSRDTFQSDEWLIFFFKLCLQKILLTYSVKYVGVQNLQFCICIRSHIIFCHTSVFMQSAITPESFQHFKKKKNDVYPTMQSRLRGLQERKINQRIREKILFKTSYIHQDIQTFCLIYIRIKLFGEENLFSKVYLKAKINT